MQKGRTLFLMKKRIWLLVLAAIISGCIAPACSAVPAVLLRAALSGGPPAGGPFPVVLARGSSRGP